MIRNAEQEQLHRLTVKTFEEIFAETSSRLQCRCIFATRPDGARRIALADGCRRWWLWAQPKGGPGLVRVSRGVFLWYILIIGGKGEGGKREEARWAEGR